jgi:hypothetical protein
MSNRDGAANAVNVWSGRPNWGADGVSRGEPSTDATGAQSLAALIANHLVSLSNNPDLEGLACGTDTCGCLRRGAPRKLRRQREDELKHPNSSGDCGKASTSSPLATVRGHGSNARGLRPRQRHHCSRPGAPAGLAWYHIDSLSDSGRVTSYDVAENAQPVMGNEERMLLLDGTMLPGPPAPTVVSKSTCMVFEDLALKKLIGMDYAVATTQTGHSGAEIQAESTPSCP